MASLDFRGMITRINVGDYWTCYIHNILHVTVGLMVLEKILKVFPIIILWQLLIPGAGPVKTPGTWLAGLNRDQ